MRKRKNKVGRVAPRAPRRDRNGLTRCRVCGCTQLDACPYGCWWVEDDLCSVCAVPVEAIADWLHDARRANKAALWREASLRAHS